MDEISGLSPDFFVSNSFNLIEEVPTSFVATEVNAGPEHHPQTHEEINSRNFVLPK